MLDFWSFFDVLRKPKPDPNLELSHDYLYDDGLTMGTLYIGRAGTGKTSSLAGHLFDYFKSHPRQAMFVLDWSGSITDALLRLIVQDDEYESLLERVALDDMGNPEQVVALPEFSLKYGSYEEQVQRVARNLTRLAPALTNITPFIGGLSFTEVAPQIFRALTVIENEFNESWQITEAKKLLHDETLLKTALKTFGYKCPSMKWWMEEVYLKLPAKEKELRSYALMSILGATDTDPIRARIGFYNPGWTPKEAIDKGLLVICDGARLINQEMTQHYLFMQVYSLIMQEINKRRPANPNDLPVTLVMDEVYSLLQIPGMAPEISKLSPQYRSRKMQLYIVLQELAQVSEELRPHIWSLGNIVCFAISNHEEAYEIAQQLFKYDPYSIKVAPVHERQNPIMEPDRGQYLSIANWIQRLEHRQCIMRRYVSEHVAEEKIQYIRKTYDLPENEPYISIDKAKEILISKRAVSVREALVEINKRELKPEKPVRPEL